MLWTRATHRLAAWLAMLAMLLGALAPTAAQAVVSAKGGPDWVQVCSASGMFWVRADGQDDPAAGKAKTLVDAARHCPWCSLQGAAGLPPAPWADIAPFAVRGELPAEPIYSATPAALWPTALSRAPPQV